MTTLDDARQLRQAGQHEQARQLLIQLTTKLPAEPEVWYQAACVHDYLGLETAAIPFYQAAIERGLAGADLRGAFLGLGSTYRTLGRYVEAAETLEAGLARFTGAAELQVFLAMVYYNLQRHHEAMALLLGVVASTSSDPDVHDYERAIRLYAEDLDRIWKE